MIATVSLKASIAAGEAPHIDCHVAGVVEGGMAAQGIGQCPPERSVWSDM